MRYSYSLGNLFMDANFYGIDQALDLANFDTIPAVLGLDVLCQERSCEYAKLFVVRRG